MKADIEGPKNPRRREFLKQAGTVTAVVALGLSAEEPLPPAGKQAKIEKSPQKESMNENAFEHKRDDFERQFSKRATIDVGDGIARAVDIIPEHPKEGAAPIWFNSPIGFSVTGFKPVIKVLSQTGRRVISVDHPQRTDNEVIELSDEQQALLKDLPSMPPIQVQKALDDIKVMEHMRASGATIIGHSAGTASGAIAALFRPDLFPEIVMFAPAGMVANDTAGRLVKGMRDDFLKAKPTLDKIPVSDEIRAYAETVGGYIPPYEAIPKSEAVQKDGARVWWEALKYALPNLKSAADEVFGLAAMQMGPLLMKLRERGVGVVIMSGVDDTVYPHTDIMDTLASLDTSIEARGPELDPVKREQRIQNFVKKIANGVVFVRGGHGQIGENPELYATYAEHMASSLEAIKRKRATSGTSG